MADKNVQQLPSFDFSFEDFLEVNDDELLDACSIIEPENITEKSENINKKKTNLTKSRFGAVDEQQMSSLLNSAQATATKSSTKWSITVLTDWCAEKGIVIDLGNVSPKSLDNHLRQFYAEAKNRAGENYSRATLLSLRNGIERFMNNPPLNRGIKLTNNPDFILSNKVLDAQIKKQKRENKENVTHKPAMALKDIEKLKTSNVLVPSNPEALLKNVWFHVSLYWCRRGREGQRALTTSSFAFEQDDHGRDYATMTHDELTKNHPGGLADVESNEKMGRMYKTDSIYDGYSSLKLYLSKVNPNCRSFFQYPLKNKATWSPTNDVWYANRPLGVNTLSKMMSKISIEAQLSRVYTNHSVRATAITLWSEAGIPDRHIMAISGHRSESSLKSYQSRPSTSQLRQCSDTLSSVLGESLQEPVNVSSTSTTQVKQTKREDSDKRPFDNMFTGCTIENIHINVSR